MLSGYIRRFDYVEVIGHIRTKHVADSTGVNHTKVYIEVHEVNPYTCDKRVSRSLRDIAYKAIYAKENLQKTRDKEPTIEEIAEEISIPKEDIVMSLDAISAPLSLYEPVYQEGGDTLYIMDQIKDGKSREELWVENLDLREAMGRLCDREKNIVRLRFFEGKTQTEVAEEISISQAQVSRLEKNAIKSLRRYLEDK